MDITLTPEQKAARRELIATAARRHQRRRDRHETPWLLAALAETETDAVLELPFGLGDEVTA